MKMTNAAMAHHADVCEKFLDDRGILGYACARNGRNLTNAAYEYITRREELLRQYGEEVKDADGNPTGQIAIKPSSENWDKIVEELMPLDNIEHEVEIMQIKPEDVMEKLTGREVMELGWMIEGWE